MVLVAADRLSYAALGADLLVISDAVWSLGCLLYAMAFGYSPFECSFYGDNELRITECTYLSVIGTVKFPSNCVYSPAFCDLIRCVLHSQLTGRPCRADVSIQLDPHAGPERASIGARSH